MAMIGTKNKNKREYDAYRLASICDTSNEHDAYTVVPYTVHLTTLFAATGRTVHTPAHSRANDP
jgi:hypothetical protein